MRAPSGGHPQGYKSSLTPGLRAAAADDHPGEAHTCLSSGNDGTGPYDEAEKGCA